MQKNLKLVTFKLFYVIEHLINKMGIVHLHKSVPGCMQTCKLASFIDKHFCMQQPKLFDGCKFYFMGDFTTAYKGYLQDLVIAAGGTILHRKPISEAQKAMSSGSSTCQTFIIYSLELPDKCDISQKPTIFNRRRSDAEALATSTGAKVASNSWVLNSIAACNLQNLAE